MPTMGGAAGERHNRIGYCRICGSEAHGFTECPEPLVVPATPPKAGEVPAAYHKRLRRNAYLAVYVKQNPKHRERVDANRSADAVEGNERHAGVLKKRGAKYQARVQRFRDFKRGKPCADCGGVFDPVCMDFDHRDPSTKARHMESMPAYLGINRSWEAFLTEIAKCDLVCANCHRVRTFKQREVGLIRRRKPKQWRKEL